MDAARDAPPPHPLPSRSRARAPDLHRRPAQNLAVFFITYKGAKGLDLDDTPIAVAFAVAFGLGGGIGLLTICTMLPLMRRHVENNFNEDGTLQVTCCVAGEAGGWDKEQVKLGSRDA